MEGRSVTKLSKLCSQKCFILGIDKGLTEVWGWMSSAEVRGGWLSVLVKQEVLDGLW